MIQSGFNLGHIQERILDVIGARLRNGELTERSLARTSGISQPHLHQILKRSKRLSPRVADLLLARLDLSVLHLFESAELELHLSLTSGQHFAYVPVLEGRLGPGHPWPAHTHRLERFPVPCRLLRTAAEPRVVRLAADPALHEGIEGRFALLERVHAEPDPGLWYAVSIAGQGMIRRVHKQNRQICFGTGLDEAWQPLTTRSDWGECVRARATILAADPALSVSA